MEARGRLVTRSATPVRWILGVSVAVALALLVAAVYLGARSSSADSPQSRTTFVQERQAPDAVERNDIYAQAIAARERALSPDATDRNAQAAYRDLLSKFNDQSPDAQERNIALIGR